MTTSVPSNRTIQKFFSQEELSALQTCPGHVAIIMDGNRRWARLQQKKIIDPLLGHWQGAQNLFRITGAAMELGVKQLTVFGFSTENWRRSPYEIKCLFNVILKALSTYEALMTQYGVRLKLIGDLTPFPPRLQEALLKAVEQTARADQIVLTLGLNYGGRDEIKRAVQAIARAVEQRKLSADNISEEIIDSYLDTHDQVDPDLLIRTSGELRISNFFLWQAAFTEFHVTPTLWPDFSPHDLLAACLDYQGRIRRMGQ